MKTLARYFLMMVCVLSGAEARAASSGGADPFVGNWSWGGFTVVDMLPNGSVHAHTPIKMDGHWKLLSRGGAHGSRQYLINWNDGQFFDTLDLSADHQRLSGQNQLGWKIAASKISSGTETGAVQPPDRPLTAAGGDTTKHKPGKAPPGVTVFPGKYGDDTADNVPEPKGNLAYGVLPLNASVVTPPGGDADSALGDIRIVFNDGHSETWTSGGKFSQPHVSGAGDIGWDRPDKVTSDRFGRNADILHVHLHDGTIKEFKPNVLFISAWAFANHDSEVVIESMAHHGPSSFIKYDIKTGRVTGEVKQWNPDVDLPKWAQSLKP